MSNTDVVRQQDPSDNFRSSFDVGYSHCSCRCQVSVCCFVGLRTVSVACNEVAVVVVLTENVV